MITDLEIKKLLDLFFCKINQDISRPQIREDVAMPFDLLGVDNDSSNWSLASDTKV
jgi:hypothetical protein